MEKKENKTRLRLVTTDETIVDAKSKAEAEKNVQLHSKFAQQMNNFSDELDRMIESILRS
jgi:hypothetical protein